MCLVRFIQRNIKFRKSPTVPPRPLGLSLTSCSDVRYLVPRNGANCSSIGQDAGVNQSTIQSLNPGIDCTFFRTMRFRKRAKAYQSFFFLEQQAAVPSQPVVTLCARDSTHPSARLMQPPRTRHAAVWLPRGTSARASLSSIMTMSTILVAILPSDNPYVLVHRREM